MCVAREILMTLVNVSTEGLTQIKYLSKIKNEDKKNGLNVPGPSLLTVFKIGNSSNSQLSHLPL